MEVDEVDETDEYSHKMVVHFSQLKSTESFKNDSISNELSPEQIREA